VDDLAEDLHAWLPGHCREVPSDKRVEGGIRVAAARTTLEVVFGHWRLGAVQLVNLRGPVGLTHGLESRTRRSVLTIVGTLDGDHDGIDRHAQALPVVRHW